MEYHPISQLSVQVSPGTKVGSQVMRGIGITVQVTCVALQSARMTWSLSGMFFCKCDAELAVCWIVCA